MAGTLTAIEAYHGVSKVVLVGDTGVGKSAFVNSYRTNHFPDLESEMPCVCERFTDIIVNGDGEEMATMLTDTCGQHNYRTCVRPSLPAAGRDLTLYCCLCFQAAAARIWWCPWNIALLCTGRPRFVRTTAQILAGGTAGRPGQIALPRPEACRWAQVRPALRNASIGSGGSRRSLEGRPVTFGVGSRCNGSISGA